MSQQKFHGVPNTTSPHGSDPRVRLPCKVFFIGFNKCATRSLHEYFCSQGVSSYHAGNKTGLHDKVTNNVAGGVQKPLDTVDQHDIYLDTEAIRINFQILDQEYPGSKFVFQYRDLNDWLLSKLNHGNGRYVDFCNRWLGLDRTWKEWLVVWRSEFLEHERAVLKYFSGRDDQFLRFDVVNDRLADLTAFIGDDRLRSQEGLPRTGVTGQKYYALQGDQFVKLEERP